MLTCAIALALLFLPSNNSAPIEHSLRASYEKQVRAIRNYYSDSHLRYDATGALIGTGHPGPWTLQYVLIDSLKLNADQVEIYGRRVAVRLAPDFHHSTYVVGRENVRIDIALPRTTDETVIRSAIEKVFYPLNYVSIENLPDYWDDLLKDNVLPPSNPADLGRYSFRTGCPSALHMDAPPKTDPSGIQSMVCGGVAIYRVKKGVVNAPQALRTNDPKYTEEARRSRYEATVVLWMMLDSTGKPQLIRIVRAVGMGLDDAAVEAVRGWRFKPAQLNGQPVAVEINVEVNFRLQ